MKRAIIISRFWDPVPAIRREYEIYFYRCVKWCLGNGYAPIGGHGIYPKVLRDDRPEERELGMKAGHLWMPVTDVAIVFQDYGQSGGMTDDIAKADEYKRPVLRQFIGKNPAILEIEGEEV